MKNTIVLDTEIGKIAISEESGSITEVFFVYDSEDIDIGDESSVLREAKAQIMEYLRGSRGEFRLPLKLYGSEFQKSVWRALIQIPYGQTRTYKDIAEAIGRPKAYRAVGSASNKNPISIIIPCHRVIGSNGRLVGYAGGLDIKEKLLVLEGSICHEK